jgi:hypothetical protein
MKGRGGKRDGRRNLMRIYENIRVAACTVTGGCMCIVFTLNISQPSSVFCLFDCIAHSHVLCLALRVVTPILQQLHLPSLKSDESKNEHDEETLSA